MSTDKLLPMISSDCIEISSPAPEVEPEPAKPLLDKQTWPGWATLESEPALFNVLMRSLGASGAQVKEVFCLDAETVQALTPVYGFIFLFRWKEEQPLRESQASQPSQSQMSDETPSLWFANQVVDNACATFALLNLLFNCPHIEPGPFLNDFKETTESLSSPLKGLAVASCETLRQQHNAFASIAEMAEADLALMQRARAHARKRRQSNASSSSKRRRKSVTLANDSDEEDTAQEDAFHFIAYIPKDGVLWELDGLEPSPIRHGKLDGHAEDWVLEAFPVIQERLDRYSAQEIRFNLLALTEDPLPALQAQHGTLLAKASKTEQDEQSLADLMTRLESCRRHHADEEQLAARRAHDYQPFLEAMLRLLNEKGILSALYSD